MLHPISDGEHLEDIERVAAALSNLNRLMILRWLKDPTANFPKQVHADIEEEGVCGVFIAEKLAVTPATASAHMRILVDAKLVRRKRIGKWTYFKSLDSALSRFADSILHL